MRTVAAFDPKTKLTPHQKPGSRSSQSNRVSTELQIELENLDSIDVQQLIDEYFERAEIRLTFICILINNK
jgi:hypothetical protein